MYKHWYDKLFLMWAWAWSCDVCKFWEIGDNISEMQYRDIVTVED